MDYTTTKGGRRGVHPEGNEERERDGRGMIGGVDPVDGKAADSAIFKRYRVFFFLQLPSAFSRVGWGSLLIELAGRYKKKKKTICAVLVE